MKKAMLLILICLILNPISGQTAEKKEELKFFPGVNPSYKRPDDLKHFTQYNSRIIWPQWPEKTIVSYQAKVYPWRLWQEYLNQSDYGMRCGCEPGTDEKGDAFLATKHFFVPYPGLHKRFYEDKDADLLEAVVWKGVDHGVNLEDPKMQYLTLRQYFIGMDTKFNSYSDLSGQIIATTQAKKKSKKALAQELNFTFWNVNDYDQMVNMLYRGRVNGILGSYLSIAGSLRSLIKTGQIPAAAASELQEPTLPSPKAPYYFPLIKKGSPFESPEYRYHLYVCYMQQLADLYDEFGYFIWGDFWYKCDFRKSWFSGFDQAIKKIDEMGMLKKP